MALNYSHRPMFPPCISEDNLVSPMRIVNGCFVEGVPDINREAYMRPWYLAQENAEVRDFNCGRDSIDFYSTQDSTSRDIVDLLPSDPFGMDIESTFTAITGWLEDLEIDYSGYMMTDNNRVGQEGYGLFGGWDLIWNDSLWFQPFPNIQFTEQLSREFCPSNIQKHDQLHSGCNYCPSSVGLGENLDTTSIVEEEGMGAVLSPPDIEFCQSVDVGDVVDFRNVSASCTSEMGPGENVDGSSNSEGMPHEAFFYALSNLGVKDLLSVEMVCKSLFSTVRGDPLLWKTIHIDQPLNEKITDDVLVQLACRSQGSLQCLSLVECPKISDDALMRILETNPRLTKLSVPGCTRINIECIVKSIKAFNSNKYGRGIKHLRIGGLFGVNDKHFEELKFLLGADKNLDTNHNPHIYHRDNFYLPYDDDRAIDIEMCPRCDKFRLVYDCPSESCKNKSQVSCRACTLCIARCAQCGRCVNDTEYEETFCLELLCSGCFKQMLKYQDKMDECAVDPSKAGPSHGPSYDFSIHG